MPTFRLIAHVSDRFLGSTEWLSPKNDRPTTVISLDTYRTAMLPLPTYDKEVLLVRILSLTKSYQSAQVEICLTQSRM